MTRIKFLAGSVLTLGLLLGAPVAEAHCDSIDGPVAAAAQKALDTNNINLALPYAPAAAEHEIAAAFARSMKVRGLGDEAKALADRAFIETTVRLHRAGEGAAYTGLKPAGTDFGPAIPAAEHAIDSGDISAVRALLADEIEHGLHARFAHVHALRQAAKEPRSASGVPDARQRVGAELAFVAYVEGLRQVAQGAAGHEHKE